MCEKIFDFTDDYDNGYTVSTQDDPFIVTHKSDGKVFTVGKYKGTTAEHIIEINSALPSMYDAIVLSLFPFKFHKKQKVSIIN